MARCLSNIWEEEVGCWWRKDREKNVGSCVIEVDIVFEGENKL